MLSFNKQIQMLYNAKYKLGIIKLRIYNHKSGYNISPDNKDLAVNGFYKIIRNIKSFHINKKLENQLTFIYMNNCSNLNIIENMNLSINKVINTLFEKLINKNFN